MSSQTSVFAWIETGVLIAAWIFVSSTVILYNKHIIDDLRFPYPCTLVMLHQACSWVLALGSSLLCRGGVAWIGARRVCGTFLPLAALFSFNLWLSNMAYIHLSVALIQMIKAITPCVVMAFSFLMGLDAPSWKLTRIISTISLGVLISTATDVGIATSGVLLGVVCQTIAIVAEALRLNLAKVALSSQDVALDSISMLVYMCPLTFVLLLAVWRATEYETLSSSHFEDVRRIGWPILLSNSSVAFLLNVSSMALVAKTSALTLNVCGIVKDFLLISWSVVVSHAVVLPVQCIGYAFSTVGIAMYTRHKHAQAARPAQAEYERLVDAEENVDDEC